LLFRQYPQQGRARQISINILAGYIILGLSLAAPIGPVNSARIDKGIKMDFGMLGLWELDP